jgi:hypothetical protein
MLVRIGHHYLPILVSMLALGIGVASAFATVGNSQPSPVAAAAHCTRYNPNTATDSWCYQMAHNEYPPFPQFWTCCYALRDGNYLQLNIVDNWQIWHVGSDTTVYANKTGYSSSGSTGGSSGHFAKSSCIWQNGGNATFSHCTSAWHD